MRVKKILCKILTLGRHWWVYFPLKRGNYVPFIYCRLCGHIAPNQWEIYKKKFQGKKKGGVTKEIQHKFINRKRGKK